MFVPIFSALELVALSMILWLGEFAEIDVGKAAKHNFIYRGFFKPDQLDALKGLATGLDVDGRGLGFTQAFHKANTTDRPFCVLNEYVSSKIGELLGLPIPPFALTFGADDQAFFSSLDFNYARISYPPILPDNCFQIFSHLCTGILVFDILIANEDRHDANLIVDSLSRPKRIVVFDHDKSLFSTIGVTRLTALREHLGIIETASPVAARHVFIDLVSDFSEITRWVGRVREIPNWFIANICNHACKETGLTEAEAHELHHELIHRRDNIGALINAHRDEFPSITEWPEELFP